MPRVLGNTLRASSCLRLLRPLFGTLTFARRSRRTNGSGQRGSPAFRTTGRFSSKRLLAEQLWRKVVGHVTTCGQVHIYYP